MTEATLRIVKTKILLQHSQSLGEEALIVSPTLTSAKHICFVHSKFGKILKTKKGEDDYEKLQISWADVSTI